MAFKSSLPSPRVPQSNWIPREQQRGVVSRLIDNKMTKLDNGRTLPLKNGGKTDIYIDVRVGRSNPDANMWLSNLYASPLRWLGVDRFVEVPEAVSGLAALLSAITGIPYATIRKDAKEGRASDSQVIGELNEGEEVVIFDDVVTDIESKIAALKLCRERKVKVRAILVLVDRQQGWEANLIKQGFAGTPVWAGMTLHDVRREAIGMGAMLRCDDEVEDKNHIIVALDGKSRLQTLCIADQLRPTGCILKVNDLIIGEGVDHLLPELAPYGRVMGDIKAHDILNTVTNVMERLKKHNLWAVTIHASASRKVLAGARETLGGSCKTKILAPTVLTSFDEKTCMEVYHRKPWSQVKALAKSVHDVVDGFVCAAPEVPMLRKLYPNTLLVPAGIRSPGVDANDQKRVDTFANAARAGADYFVSGRQILNASDPVAEVDKILVQIRSGQPFLGGPNS